MPKKKPVKRIENKPKLTRKQIEKIEDREDIRDARRILKKEGHRGTPLSVVLKRLGLED